jgi:hypothetical protein
VRPRTAKSAFDTRDSDGILESEPAKAFIVSFAGAVNPQEKNRSDCRHLNVGRNGAGIGVRAGSDPYNALIRRQ